MCSPWAGKLIQKHPTNSVRRMSIRNIHGLWAGKTPHESSYGDLMEYASNLKPVSEYTEPNRVGFETDEDFAMNCRYLEERRRWISGTDDGQFRVIYREWDGKYFFMNSDGAHHFAAVYRQCIKQDRDFIFECILDTHSLDATVCEMWLKNFHCILLSSRCAESLAILLNRFGHVPPIHDCEYEYGKSLLRISLNKPRSKMIVESVCSTLPENCFFDLSEYLRACMEGLSSQ
jgi:hypothetical protein